MQRTKSPHFLINMLPIFWTTYSSLLKPPMNFWNRFNINTMARFFIDGLNYINREETNFILILLTDFCDWQNWRPAYFKNLEPTLPVVLWPSIFRPTTCQGEQQRTKFYFYKYVAPKLLDQLISEGQDRGLFSDPPYTPKICC